MAAGAALMPTSMVCALKNRLAYTEAKMKPADPTIQDHVDFTLDLV